jgi:hypothetical protein
VTIRAQVPNPHNRVMPAPKVDQPESAKAPAAEPLIVGGVPVTDGPIRDKNLTFLKAAYPVGNGIYRVDHGTKV